MSDSSDKENSFANEADEMELMTFRQLRSDLNDVLDGEDKQNLTTGMSLGCVLYLANEKGLELKSTSLNDFTIYKPPSEDKLPVLL